MTAPTNTWDETKPAGNRAINFGDDDIREMKTQLREVIAMDHVMTATSASTDTPATGYHNKVTFVEQGSSPSMVDNTLMIFAKAANSKTELFMDSYDMTGSEQQLTENGNWIGGIQYEVRMFSGLTANIPTGWVICDGNNSTPNLSDKFVRSTTDTITNRAWTGEGAFGTGGANTVTLSEANLAAHTHSGTTGNQSADHAHSGTTASATVSASFYTDTGSSSGAYLDFASSRQSIGISETFSMGGHTHTITTGGVSANHTHTITVGSTGSGTAFSILPSYVELLFIMKS